MASTVICPSCGTSSDGQDSMCRVYSAPLYDGEAGYDPQPGAEGHMPSVQGELVGPPTVSSSGRRGASPAERAAFLAERAGRLGDLGLRVPSWMDGTPPLFTQIADAERALAATEADLDEARARWSYARQACRSEALDERDLDPEQRHRYVQLKAAEDRFYRCQVAAGRAHRRLNVLLAEYEKLASLPGRYPQLLD